MNTQTQNEIVFIDELTRRRRKTDETLNEINNIKNDIKM